MRALKLCTATAALMLAAATVGVVRGADELVWKDLFAPPYATTPEIAMSIQCVSKNRCFIPGGSNGVGFGVYEFNGQTEGSMAMMNEPNMTMMILTAAMGGTEAKPVGAFGGVGILTISDALQYLQNGTTWLPSTTPFEFVWETQSMRGTDDGQHIIALGSGPAGNSIMHSSNAGASFNPQTINIPPMEKDCTFPNYAAMVNGSTWYITLGGEPGENNNNNNVNAKFSRIQTSLRSGFDWSGRPLKHHHHSGKKAVTAHDLIAMKRSLKRSRRDEPQCHYTGQVARTTDAGKTWTVLFQTAEYTFAQIDCISVNRCVTVGWGANAANQSISVILTMTDGKTWKETLRLTNSPVGFQTVRWADAQEVWVGGGVETQTEGAGVFYVSKDGGLTWAQSGGLIPNVMIIFDMSFTTGGVGFAIGMTMFKTSTVLRYEKQEFNGYFTQSQCLDAKCSFLCQNITFAQGMCLETQGGSVQAMCSNDAVVQKVYQTTSCVGAYTTESMPINQCLNNSGSYFENICNTSALSVARTHPRRSGFFRFLGF